MHKVLKMTEPEKEALPALRSRAEHYLTKTRDEICEMPPRDAAELVYELQVHQLELKMQNDELQRVQDELRASRQKYCDLYEFAPVGYLTLDRFGTITEANLLASLWLGRPAARLQGRKFSDFILPKFMDQYLEHYHAVFADGGKQSTELQIASKDEMFVQISSQVNIPDDGCCCTVLTDITRFRG